MSILAALVPPRFLYYTDIIKSKEGTLMTKQEISEIKKLFTPKNCSITRICGCYVDGEKNKKRGGTSAAKILIAFFIKKAYND